jgi:signal peptidase I
MSLAALPARLLRSALLAGALRLLTWVAAAVFALLVLLPHTGLYRTAVPLSGSMEPTFAPGDLLLLRAEPLSRIRVGQVITYTIPIGDHHLETHRVVRVLRGGNEPVVQTKGDANRVRDPWTAVLHGRTVWRVERVVPRAGSALLWLGRPFVRVAFVLLLAGLLLHAGLVRIWLPPQRRAE